MNYPERIANRYKILEPINQGSMGIVYRAYDLLTGDLVALKQVSLPKRHASLVDRNVTSSINPEGALRMAVTKEFQTLASLRHPNIISVLDYGFDAQGQPYFTMPLLNNAKTIIEAGKAAPLPDQMEYIVQTLQALAYLHRREILHRDLKPENILVVGGQVQLLDFGLSVERSDDQQRAGTIAYMSPEMILTGRVSELSDQYTVGVLAYEMLTGHHPFQTSHAQMFPSILNEDPDYSLLPDSVRPIIARLMAKTAAERYPNISDVIIALSQAVDYPSPIDTPAIRDSYLQASRFIGRNDELKQLSQALDQAAEGRGSMWLVGGESGIGKSRLLDEIRIRALVKGAIVISGQAMEEHGQPFQLWREPLRRLILITEVDKLEASVLKPLIPDIEALLGYEIPDAPLLKEDATERLLLTMAALFRKAAQNSPPLVLLLDDLQWVVESLDPLIPLIRLIAETPLLIIGTYRTEERPQLPDEIPGSRTILLNRFTPKEIEALSLSMLGETGTQRQVLQLLQAETEGNVYFLVETVRVLAEEAGTLDNIGKMTLPETVFAGGVQQVIQRRLRRVPKKDRPLLRLAAVAGRVLPLDALSIAIPDVDLNAWLQTCLYTTILEVRENRYQFAHDKLRDTLIAQLTEDERFLFNQQVALALEQIHPDDPEYAGRLCKHWLAGGEPAKAAHYAEIAGRYALTSFANEEALQFFSQALELLPATTTTKRYSLLLARERLYHLQGKPDLQAQDLTELERLGASMGNEEKAEIALRRASYAAGISDYATAIQAAETAIQLSDDLRVHASAYLRLGRGFWRAGDNEQALDRLAKALEIAKTAHLYELMGDIYRLMGLVPRRVNTHEGIMHNMERALHAYRAARVPDRSGEAWALNNLGTTAYYQGIYDAAQTYLVESAALFQKIGDKRGEGQALYNIGHLHWLLGDYLPAWDSFQRALKTWQETGNRRGESSAYRGLGMVTHHQGNYQDSLQYHQTSLEITIEINHRQGEGLTLTFLGHTLAALERIPEAIQTYHRTINLWRELNIPGVFPDARAGLARVYLRLGDLAQAKTEVNLILDLLAVRDFVFPEELFRIYLTCYLVLVATNDPRAPEFFQSVHQKFQKHTSHIPNEALRQSFLNNVPWHKTLVALWEGKKHTA